MNKSKAQAAILHNLTRRGLKLKDFGESIGQSQKSGYNKFNNPKMLTAEDMGLMRLTRDEALEILDL